jgi:hypothetical protein
MYCGVPAKLSAALVKFRSSGMRSCIVRYWYSYVTLCQSYRNGGVKHDEVAVKQSIACSGTGEVWSCSLRRGLGKVP